MGILKSLGALYGNPLRIWCLTREFCHPFLVLGCEMMIHPHAHVLLWRGDILAEALVKSVKTPSSTRAFLEVLPTPNTYIPVTLSCTCTSAPDTRPPPCSRTLTCPVLVLCSTSCSPGCSLKTLPSSALQFCVLASSWR